MPEINLRANFTCHFNIKKPLLSVKVKGHATAIDMLNSYYEAISIAKSEGAEKILLDMRDLYMAYESFDMLNIMNILEKKLTTFKVARLVNKQYQKNLVIQEIAFNKNMLLRNFESEIEATHWLNS